MPSYESYETAHLYLLPFEPISMDLYKVVLNGRLAAAGSATVRLALYRIAQPLGILQRRTPITGASPISVDFVREFEIEYSAYSAPTWTVAAAITSTSTWARIVGKLEPEKELLFEIDYMLGLAVRQQTVDLAAPTLHGDMPAYRCSSQNPGVGGFPNAPSIDRVVRTPAMTLLSARRAATLGL